MAIRTMMALASSKQWSHFRLVDLWLSMSTILMEEQPTWQQVYLTRHWPARFLETTIKLTSRPPPSTSVPVTCTLLTHPPSEMCTLQFLWLVDELEVRPQLLECSFADRECPSGQSSYREGIALNVYTKWSVTCRLTICQNQRYETHFFYQSMSVCPCLPRGSL